MNSDSAHKELFDDWTEENLRLAREVLPGCLGSRRDGTVQDLAKDVIKAVAERIGRESDDDALIDELRPFELLEEVLTVCANDCSSGFMGPSYYIYRVYRLEVDWYLVVDDRMEELSYDCLTETATLEAACEFIGPDAMERLGGGDEVEFDGFGSLSVDQVREADPGFWARYFLRCSEGQGSS